MKKMIAMTFGIIPALCLANPLIVGGSGKQSAQGAHAVCRIADFNEFFGKYISLSWKDQLSCVQFPVRQPHISNREIKSASGWKKNVKVVSSAADLKKRGVRTHTPFYFQRGRYSGGGANVFSYVLDGKGGNTHTASLSTGGTTAYDRTTFRWDGSSWRVVRFEDLMGN